MTITTLFGTRLATGLGALAIAFSLAGGTAHAAEVADDTASKDNAAREIRKELKDATKAEREALKDLRKQFAAEFAKDKPDEAKLDSLHKAMEAKKTKIAAMKYNALMDMHDELDPEQRERLAERMAEGKQGKKGEKAKKGDKAKKGKQVKKGKQADEAKRDKRTKKTKQAKKTKKAKQNKRDKRDQRR